LPIAREERGTEHADLRRGVERVVAMARLTKDLESIEIEQHLPAEVVLVRGGEGRVEQIVLNLLLNAGRVMQTGRITITLVSAGRTQAELVIEDEGPGIDPPDLEHIFDPFFSKTGGTGLGLSVSYGIAKALAGDLIAENRDEGGARFRLRLPRVDEGLDGGMSERT
jgi:two-component system C4-dicarboxylate transport sensor histidine kinase DctB